MAGTARTGPSHVVILAWNQGQYDQSSALITQSAALSHSTGNARYISMAWDILALLAAYRGEYETAVEWHRQSLALMRESGDLWGVVAALGTQGVSALNLKRFDEAETSLTEALAINRKVGNVWVTMYCSTYLGLTLVQIGKHWRAEQLLQEGLRLVQVLGPRVSLPEGLEGLAAIAVTQGHNELAVQLSGAAEALRELVGFFTSPAVQSIREGYLARARSQMDDAAFNAAWAVGRALSLEQAIALALQEEGK